MKNIYCIFIFLFHICSLFSQEGGAIEKIDTTQYVIIKIDSIDNYYVINALSNQEKYKIISLKIHGDCSNLYEGKVCKLTLSPIFPSTASHHFEQEIGIGTDVKIDWGSNLYIAQELYGLCYEKDTVKLKRFKRLINQQYEFEATIQTIYLCYNIKRNKHATIKDFYEHIINNSTSFTLSEIDSIPVYFSPRSTDIKYELIIDSASHKTFIGKIIFEYQKLYLIQGHYKHDDEIEFLGWIDQKYISKIKRAPCKSHHKNKKNCTNI